MCMYNMDGYSESIGTSFQYIEYGVCDHPCPRALLGASRLNELMSRSLGSPTCHILRTPQ